MSLGGGKRSVHISFSTIQAFVLPLNPIVQFAKGDDTRKPRKEPGDSIRRGDPVSREITRAIIKWRCSNARWSQ